MLINLKIDKNSKNNENLIISKLKKCQAQKVTKSQKITKSQKVTNLIYNIYDKLNV